MAFSASDIKNLALMELNHETISDWSDSTNTDIPIINTQYTLAKSVALTMYQWSWAFKYAMLTLFDNFYDKPSDWVAGTGISLYTVPKAVIRQIEGDWLNELSIDPEQFATQINDSGAYVFKFNGSVWKDEDNNTVDLSTYGITYDDTPVSGDELLVNFTASVEITSFSSKTTNARFYVDNPILYLDYVATGDVATRVKLSGTSNSKTNGRFGKATYLPDDLLGYLACYTNDKLTILAEYTTVGDVVYTNSDELHIKYIAEIDESAFPPEFVDWFKIFLAQRLNGYLNGDMQRQQLLTNEEPFYFRKAKNIDSKRNKHDSLSGNPLLWIRGRLGGGI